MKEAKPSTVPAKGMRDLLPAQVATRDWATARILDVYASYGFTRIETPAVENLAVLMGSQGGENEKLIFKVMKRGEKLSAADASEQADLGLRFDLTVPLVRYYAAPARELAAPVPGDPDRPRVAGGAAAEGPVSASSPSATSTSWGSDRTWPRSS